MIVPQERRIPQRKTKPGTGRHNRLSRHKGFRRTISAHTNALAHDWKTEGR